MAWKQQLLMVLQWGDVVAHELRTNPLALLEWHHPLRLVW